MTWLDMSKSLLSCWEDVGGICLQLEQLHTLMLGCVCAYVRVCVSVSLNLVSMVSSSNRLRSPSDPVSLGPAFRHLSVLSLVGCDLTWPQVSHHQRGGVQGDGQVTPDPCSSSWAAFSGSAVRPHVATAGGAGLTGQQHHRATEVGGGEGSQGGGAGCHVTLCSLVVLMVSCCL